jgi:hypothetical protein
MNPHRQHYKPQQASEPSALVTLAGAALAVLAVWLITVFLFSL